MKASAPTLSNLGCANDSGSEDRSRAMLITSGDFHARYGRIAMTREETGELLVERRLHRESGEALAFCRSC